MKKHFSRDGSSPDSDNYTNFFLIPPVDHTGVTTAERLVGTLQVHSIRNVGIKGVVEHRRTSCMCDGCFTSTKACEPSCKNSALVEDFTRTAIIPDTNIHDTNRLFRLISLR